MLKQNTAVAISFDLPRVPLLTPSGNSIQFNYEVLLQSLNYNWSLISTTELEVDTEYKKVDKVDIDIDWLINHKTLRDTKINRNHLSHALMHYIMYFFLL